MWICKKCKGTSTTPTTACPKCDELRSYERPTTSASYNTKANKVFEEHEETFRKLAKDD